MKYPFSFEIVGKIKGLDPIKALEWIHLRLPDITKELKTMLDAENIEVKNLTITEEIEK